MPDLIPPHGGLAEPVSCTVAPGEADALVAAAARQTKIPVSDADLSSVYRFGDGGLSPLTGPNIPSGPSCTNTVSPGEKI